jgi:thioredoxin-dependent peroxiredoxin
LAKTPETGQAAPDFTLPGLEIRAGAAIRSDYTLSAQRGNPMVLAFYPGDNTTVCTRQLCSYTSGLEAFTGFGASVWAISPQGLDSHERFARRYNLGFPLLADEGLKVSQQYGIAVGGAMLRRSVFVIDAGGILVWKHVTLVGLTFPSAQTISAKLEGIKVG